MELYTLNLSRPIAYRAAGRSGAAFSLASIMGEAADAPDGYESLLLWDYERAVGDGPDGPKLADPMPPPDFEGNLAGAGDEIAAELGAGSWLFCQHRAEGDARGDSARGDEAALAALAFLAREAWWRRSPARGPIALRLVKEDGKLAAQALRRKADPA